MNYIKLRVKGMFEPIVLVSSAFVMMTITLLLVYRVLSGSVPDVVIASKVIKIMILFNLALDAGTVIRVCIPVIREIHRNGFISLFKISDENVDEDE